jgi:hypothetical protein
MKLYEKNQFIYYLAMSKFNSKFKVILKKKKRRILVTLLNQKKK